MTGAWTIYRRWLRDRLVFTAVWSVGVVLTVVVTAAFYPALSGQTMQGLDTDGAAMSSLLGLGAGIDPASPLGYLWIALYANVYPWMLMALGVVLGVAAIAGDEETGALEYLLSKPVNRTSVVIARYLGAITILGIVAALSALSLILTLGLFDLDQASATTALDGSVVTSPGATVGDVLNGTIASFAVGLGLAGIAFLLGAATGRKGLSLGVSTGIGLGGYVIYTLSNMTDSLGWLTWLSPWRWYTADAMLINGLTWNVALPFATAVIGLLAGWWAFLHRDLRNP